MPAVMDHLLEQDFIRVTEQAAIAAAHTMGFGDRKYSDQVAVEAMREEMDNLQMRRPRRHRRGRARQGADALRRRGAGRAARPGRRRPRSTSPSIRWRAPTSAPPARPTRSPCSPPPSAAACSTLPTSTWTSSSSARRPRGVVHLDAPVAENLRNIADAFERDVSDLTIVVLDRAAPRAAHRRHPRGRRAHPADHATATSRPASPPPCAAPACTR